MCVKFNYISMPKKNHLSNIKSRLQNDPNYAINFIIDNNPDAIDVQLNALGIVSDAGSRSKQDLRNEVQRLITEGRKDDVIFVLNVPYINRSVAKGKLNYTSGLGTWLKSRQQERNFNPNTPPSDIISEVRNT